MPASFLVARAALAEAADPNELKSQKWFIYPSLIIVYSFVLFWLFAWPVFTLPIAAYELERNVRSSYLQFDDDLRYWIMATSFIIAGLGLWWIVLAGLLLKCRRLLQVLFKPFGDWFNRKWALVLLLIGLGLMIPSLGLGIWYWL